MPYSKVDDHPECDGIAVVKDETGEVMGCHDSEAAANEQIAALYAAEEEAASKSESASDEEPAHHEAATLTYHGGTVKALDDGKVGGYLVRFTSADDPDLENDFFTAETDFGPADKSATYFDHGMDVKVGRRVIGEGVLKQDEVGIWIEAQLERRDRYEEAIYELAKQGKLGWSSGTAAHLVERERVGKAYHIKKWPLGLDASLTPEPAEPRNTAQPLKSTPRNTLKSLLETTLADLDASTAPEGATSSKSSQADGPQASRSGDATAAATGTGERPHTPNDASAKHHVHVQPSTETMSQQTETKAAETEAQAPTTEKSEAQLLEEYKADLITKNEYRKARGLEPEEGGDRYFSQIKAQSSEKEEQKAQGGRTVKGQYEESAAPAYNHKTGLGDSEAKALAHWIKTGDIGGMKHLQSHESGVTLINPTKANIKASNDTSMNITTPADGGNAVPTGHFEGIIARRDPAMLSTRLGVQRIPGEGTTVNVPVDNEDDGEFVETGEQNDDKSNNFDRDAPAIGQVAMTLKKYTKKVELTDELLEDEESRLLAFLENFIGRGMAKTHNNLLLTEVATNGTSFKTFASADAIAAGEIEDIVGNDDLGAYLEDDGGSVSWVGRNSTLWDIKSITGNDRQYATQVIGTGEGPDLLGYPFLFSNKAGSIGANAKSLYFGNWFYVGWREAPGMQIIRDIYSVDGMTVLKYYFRTTYDVLQAEAIGYGEHPSA